MMPARYFTLEEANALLPELEPLMKELLERRARVVHRSKQMADLLAIARSDFGGQVPSELVAEFSVIERLVGEIQSFGCVIKSLNAGLLDFLSVRQGRDVYLCWRYGEERIAYFHDLHTGFQGREQI